MFAEVDGDVRAYGLTGHRHGPPRSCRKPAAAGIVAPIVFSPHVVPLRRGILADVYLIPKASLTRAEVLAAYERFYGASRSSRSSATSARRTCPRSRAPTMPTSALPNGRASCRCSRHRQPRQGRRGSTVQNMNLMLGLPEELGLDARTIAR